jgi:hypothetical protein
MREIPQWPGLMLAEPTVPRVIYGKKLIRRHLFKLPRDDCSSHTSVHVCPSRSATGSCGRLRAAAGRLGDPAGISHGECRLGDRTCPREHCGEIIPGRNAEFPSLWLRPQSEVVRLLLQSTTCNSGRLLRQTGRGKNALRFESQVSPLPRLGLFLRRWAGQRVHPPDAAQAGWRDDCPRKCLARRPVRVSRRIIVAGAHARSRSSPSETARLKHGSSNFNRLLCPVMQGCIPRHRAMLTCW